MNDIPSAVDPDLAARVDEAKTLCAQGDISGAEVELKSAVTEHLRRCESSASGELQEG